MRNLFIVVLFFIMCMGAAATLSAQSQPVQTVQATVSAGGNADHFYAAVGQPFFQQATLELPSIWQVLGKGLGSICQEVAIPQAYFLFNSSPLFLR